MFDPLFPLGFFLGPLALGLLHHFEMNRPSERRLPDWKSIVLALVSVWGLSYGILIAMFVLIAGGGPLSEENFVRLVWTARVASVLLVGLVFYRCAKRRSKPSPDTM